MAGRSADGPVLSVRALNRALLARQLLLAREHRPGAETIEHLVGLQAQIPTNPYLSLWSRLEPFRPEEIASMIEERRAVRIALMRSTIHLVTDEDCLTLRPLVQPALDRMFGPRSAWTKAVDGVDVAELLDAGRRIVEERPRGHKEIGDLLHERWPQHDRHAMALAIRNGVPLVQVPPRGVWGKAGRPLVTSAEAWIGRPLATDPSIDDVVLRYLKAFGPAGPADFRRWSGLTGHTDVFERLRPQLLEFRDEAKRRLFDVPDAPRPEPDAPAPVRFFPEYDNVLLSHADRSRIIGRGALDAGTIGKPAFTVDGFVAGTWTIDRKKDRATVTVCSFARLRKAERTLVLDEATAALEFLVPDRHHDVRFDE